MAATFTGKPYYELSICSYSLRYFRNKIPEELFWHRDNEDRRVWLLWGNAKLQYDNQIPQQLQLLKSAYIPKMIFHRVISDVPFLMLIKRRNYV